MERDSELTMEPDQMRILKDGAEDRVVEDRSASAGSLGPVGEGDRILTLDVLRGFALFGILCMNIQWFAMPQLDAIYGAEGDSQLDTVCSLGLRLFVGTKFITLFSMLFGMGLVLQRGRAQKAGRPFVWMYVRRLLVLAGLGLMHGFLLWWGDILFAYSLAGFGLLVLSRLKPGALLATAAGCIVLAFALYSVPTVLYLMNGGTSPESVAVEDDAPPEEPWELVGDPVAADSSDEPRWFQALRESEGNLLCAAGAEAEDIAYGQGPMAATMTLRAVAYIDNVAVINFRYGYIWRTLAMFLLGAALMKWGLFGRRGAVAQRWLCALGICLGLTLEGFYVWAYGHYYWEVYWLWYLGTYVHAFGAIMLSLGYATGICLLVSSGIVRPVAGALACAGRMALTNYLGQTAITSAMFYWWGLGLWGQVPRIAQLVLVVMLFTAQVCFSLLWLRFFRFGPLEWVWRSLTYGRPQPMIR